MSRVASHDPALTGAAARKLLECYDLPVNPAYLAKNAHQAATIAN